jgi:hypothetical protein
MPDDGAIFKSRYGLALRLSVNRICIVYQHSSLRVKSWGPHFKRITVNNQPSIQ